MSPPKFLEGPKTPSLKEVLKYLQTATNMIMQFMTPTFHSEIKRLKNCKVVILLAIT